MKRLLTKKWFYGVLLTIALGLVVFSLPSVSHAGFLDVLSPSGLITGAFKIIAYIFNFIFGLLFMLAAWMVEIMMKMNSTVLDPTKNTIVGVGWPIARDIANLGFVIVMIIIAVATIVRYREYGAKQLLPKLIAAAIIVNFSLTIMALFVNFSNTVTNFFVNQGVSVGGGYSLTGALADAFGPQKFLIDDQDPAPPNPEEEVGSFTTITTGVLSSLAGLSFTVVFTLLAAFVFLAFAFLLLLRFLYLTFLAILSPLIWLFWVFPPLRSQYSKWWSKFISWTFFAPAASFFMYLALASVKGLAEKSASSVSSGSYFGASVLGGIMQQGVQMIIVAGVMVGGLLIAEKMGVTGATAMANIARGAGNGLRKYAGARTIQGLQGISKTAPAQAIAGVAGKAGVRLQKLGGGYKIRTSDELDEQGNVVKKKDTTGTKLLKRVANVATFGLREPASLYGDTLTGTEKGVKGLASREKVKAGSLMGQMLSGAGEKAGFSSKKAEGAKEPMKQSDKKKGLGELAGLETQGVINSADLNSRRMKIYNEMDYSDGSLIGSEVKTLSAERAQIESDLKKAEVSGDKNKAESLQQKAKYNQSQQETLVSKVQDEQTAREVLKILSGEGTKNYDQRVLDPRVLGSQLRKLETKLEGSPAVEEGLTLAIQEKENRRKTIAAAAALPSTPANDATLARLKADDAVTDRRIEQLAERYDKGLGKAEDSDTAKANREKVAKFRDSFLRQGVDSSSLKALNETVAEWDSDIKRMEEAEKKGFGVEKIIGDRLESLDTLRTQYVRGNNAPAITKTETEIKLANDTLGKFREFRGKRPQGAAEWGARRDDIKEVIKTLVQSGLVTDINDARIVDLKNYLEAAEDKFAELNEKKVTQPKTIATPPPVRPEIDRESGYTKTDGGLYVPPSSFSGKKDDEPTTS